MHQCVKKLAPGMWVTEGGLEEYSNLPLCIRIQILLTLWWTIQISSQARIFHKGTHGQKKLLCLHS